MWTHRYGTGTQRAGHGDIEVGHVIGRGCSDTGWNMGIGIGAWGHREYEMGTWVGHWFGRWSGAWLQRWNIEIGSEA